MNAVFLRNSILLGVGLAMDAFSVSLACGLDRPGLTRRQAWMPALVFGVFQFLMPLIGYLPVRMAAEAFTPFADIVHWVAAFLLFFIGGKMLYEGWSQRKDALPAQEEIRFSRLLVLGLATSLDALSVGFAIASYTHVQALVSALLIGMVTVLICRLGVQLGRDLGRVLSRFAPMVGGILLIGIGLEMAVKAVRG